jgi:hypothetical protein
MTRGRSTWIHRLLLCAAVALGAACTVANPPYHPGAPARPDGSDAAPGDVRSPALPSDGPSAEAPPEDDVRSPALPSDGPSAETPPEDRTDGSAYTITPPTVDLSSGLVGYWPLDEGAGNSVVNDLSGKANHGKLTLVNMDTAWQPGHIGRALEIPQLQGAAVVVASSDSINSIIGGVTISAWVFRNVDLGAKNMVVLSRQRERGTGNRELYNLAFDGNKLVGWFADPGVASMAVRSTQAAPLMKWLHVAVTWDGSTVRLYQDGVAVGSGAYSSPIETSTNPLLLGNNANSEGLNQPLVGRLDQVRLYNRALPIEAIRALSSER